MIQKKMRFSSSLNLFSILPVDLYTSVQTFLVGEGDPIMKPYLEENRDWRNFISTTKEMIEFRKKNRFLLLSSNSSLEFTTSKEFRNEVFNSIVSPENQLGVHFQLLEDNSVEPVDLSTLDGINFVSFTGLELLPVEQEKFSVCRIQHLRIFVPCGKQESTTINLFSFHPDLETLVIGSCHRNNAEDHLTVLNWKHFHSLTSAQLESCACIDDITEWGPLRGLGVTNCSDLHSFDESNLEILKIQGCAHIPTIPLKLNQNKLKQLNYTWLFENSFNLLYHFSDLIKLVINFQPSDGISIGFDFRGFQALESLSIFNTNKAIKVAGMNHLKELWVASCPGLIDISGLSRLQKFHSLGSKSQISRGVGDLISIQVLHLNAVQYPSLFEEMILSAKNLRAFFLEDSTNINLNVLVTIKSFVIGNFPFKDQFPPTKSSIPMIDDLNPHIFSNMRILHICSNDFIETIIIPERAYRVTLHMLPELQRVIVASPSHVIARPSSLELVEFRNCALLHEFIVKRTIVELLVTRCPA
jgi:hypothetical protein